MKTVKLNRQSHNGEQRLTLSFNYDPDLVRITRGLDGVRWSRTMNCHHLPYNEISINKIMTVFGSSVDIDITSLAGTPEIMNIKIQKKVLDKDENVTEGDEEFFVDCRPWKVNNPVNELDKNRKYGAVRFSIDMTGGKLVIKFLGKYRQEWIKELKSYGKVQYDENRKEWLLPWSQIAVDSLSDYFGYNGVKINVEKIGIPEIVKEQREDRGQEIRERVLGRKAEEGIEHVRQYLKERRYSAHTIEAYVSLLELFFKYFSTIDPEKIGGEDISVFFKDFIVSHNYSSSYQNQLVSAIKMFYRLNRQSDIDIESLGRPRRGRTLPKVFSKEEVQSILNSGYNIKHKLILWLIYSCGLRRSEVINIKISDFERDRGILNIREAKGMVDRIVPVSARVWKKLDEYIEAYKPALWLFEGSDGGRYSVESVYRIFKQALKRAGIDKEVGVHSLRHSYATHLHESGLDIRYIQELLGHKSTRTTEIYTHVSRRNLIQIKSPIDDLDLK